MLDGFFAWHCDDSHSQLRLLKFTSKRSYGFDERHNLKHQNLARTCLHSTLKLITHNPISDNPVPSNEQTEQKEQNEQYDSTLYSEELVYGSKKKLANVYRGRVVTKPELAEHG